MHPNNIILLRGREREREREGVMGNTVECTMYTQYKPQSCHNNLRMRTRAGSDQYIP